MADANPWAELAKELILAAVTGTAVYFHQRHARASELAKLRLEVKEKMYAAENAFAAAEQDLSKKMSELVDGLAKGSSAEDLCKLREECASKLEEHVLPRFRQFAELTAMQASSSTQVDEFVVVRVVPELDRYTYYVKSLNLPSLCERVGRKSPVQIDNSALYQLKYLAEGMSHTFRQKYENQLTAAIERLSRAHLPESG